MFLSILPIAVYGIESQKIEIYREFIAETVEYISEKQKDADSLEQEIERLILT